MALGFFNSEETMTPEGVERRRKLVDVMREKSLSTAPIKHWTEGVARLAQALRAGWDEDALNTAETTGRKQADERFAPLLAALGGGGGPATSNAGAGQPVSLPGATTSGPTGSASIPNVASGKDVYNGLVERGLSPVLASGFTGNFHGESGFNTGAWGDNGTSYGIGQWRGDRLNALRQLAAQQGKDPSDLGVQLDHVMSELNGPEARALRLASAATTPEQAAQLIAQHYERPAAWALAQSGPKRAAFARGVFDQYGQPAPTAQPVQTASLGPVAMPAGAPQPQLPPTSAGGPMAYTSTGQPVTTDASGNAVAPGSGGGTQAIARAMMPTASPTAAPMPQQPAAAAPVQVAQNGGLGRAALVAAMGVMNDRWASPGQKAVAQAILSKGLTAEQDEWVRLNDGALFNKRTGSTRAVNGSAFRMLTDPAERRAMGIPDDDKRAYQVEPGGKLTAVGGASTNVNVDTKGETAEAQELGKLNAKAVDAMRTAGDNAPMQISKLNLLERILGGIQTGAFADTKAEIARYGKALGVSDETMKSWTSLDPNSPAAREQATKLINEMTMGMIGPGGFPANNFSDADRAFLRDIFPKISNQPEANQLAIEVLRRVQVRNAEKLQAWDDFSEQQAAGGKRPSFEEFERSYRKSVRGKDLFADIKLPTDKPAPKATPQAQQPARRSVGGKTYEKRDDGWYEVTP